MAKHNETGIKGEEIAEKFLQTKGYKILHKNWTHDKKEVDIIAIKDHLLVFVEVKTRANTQFGFPEDAVNEIKQEHLRVAAEEFLHRHPEYTEIRFDIISVILSNGHEKEVVHFEDAFF